MLPDADESHFPPTFSLSLSPRSSPSLISPPAIGASPLFPSLRLFHLIPHPHSSLSARFIPPLRPVSPLSQPPLPLSLSLFAPFVSPCTYQRITGFFIVLQCQAAGLTVVYRPAFDRPGRGNGERRFRVTWTRRWSLCYDRHLSLHFIVEIYERTLYIRHATARGAWLLLSAAFERLNAPCLRIVVSVDLRQL